MVEVIVARTVAAPPERVWSVLTDNERYPQRIDSYVEVALVTPPPLDSGSSWRQTRVVSAAATA